jgi:DNA repair exonuclease SbcCD ATPase subunit
MTTRCRTLLHQVRGATARAAPWLMAVVVLAALPGWQRPAAGQPAASDRGTGLAGREQELLRQYRELERSFLRLADLLEASDPRRAAILRAACERARGEQIADRFEVIVVELEAGRLLKAGAEQREAIGRLEALLQMLAAGVDGSRPPDGREQVRQFLGRVTRAIARQREIQGGTESGAAPGDLADRQETLADETRALAEDLEQFVDRSRGRPAAASRPAVTPEGKEPGAGRQDPADGAAGGAGDDEEGDDEEGDDDAARASRTRKRLQAAEQRMRQARKAVEEARRREARAEQEKALEALETARAELEQILRQLREEEVERLLVQLAARVRQMLKAEVAVRSGVGETVAAGGPTGREQELEAARLAREQAKIGAAARRALALLRDDGSAVAIPQALEQVRDDSDEAARRLERGDLGGTTRGLLDDLVVALEEMLAAVERARTDRQQQAAGRQGEGRPARPGEQPLVDALAELRMIRSLQARVNTRTARLAQLLGDGVDHVEEPELRAALGRLAERQRLIERAAFDIVQGRTE